MTEERPMSAGKCCQCGCHVWLTPSHYQAAMEGRSKIPFHCGYGHQQHFCDEDDAFTKLQRERNRLVQQMAEREDRIAQLTRLNDKVSGENKKLQAEAKKTKRRISHGTCPCCHRTFSQLAKHMTIKHPEYVQ
jgi:hypothetical protein